MPAICFAFILLDTISLSPPPPLPALKEQCYKEPICLQGHRIILPEGISVAEPLPLIIIGSGKRLTLQNVTLVHADSLPACLQLGAGSRLLAEEIDKVTMIKGADPDLPEELQAKYPLYFLHHKH